MFTTDRRLAIRRSFSGVSLVDELERLFIDHGSTQDSSPRPWRLPSAEQIAEPDRCGYNCGVSLLSAVPKKKNTKKRPQFSHTKSVQNSQMCLFCRRNGEVADVYLSHNVKDSHGKVSCPVLFRYVCPMCGATGPDAHTVSRCPSRRGSDDVCSVLALKTLRNSAGRRRYVRT